jgi:hypothetical protein
VSEPMHLSVSREITACGLDRRGKRTTRDLRVVTCKHCAYELSRAALKRFVDSTRHVLK